VFSSRIAGPEGRALRAPSPRKAAGARTSSAAAWFWQDVRDGAIAVLPEWAREKYAYGAPPLTPGSRAGIRQSLSVLDAMVLGESGVLEGRSGSPCGCGQRGLHEGPEARRRGSRTEPRRWADHSSPTWWLAAHRLADQL